MFLRSLMALCFSLALFGCSEPAEPAPTTKAAEPEGQVLATKDQVEVLTDADALTDQPDVDAEAPDDEPADVVQEAKAVYYMINEA